MRLSCLPSFLPLRRGTFSRRGGLLGCLLLLAATAWAEDVFLKDGTAQRGIGLRRDGAIVFGKPESGPETLIPVNNIARILFRESSGLRDARDGFFAGDSRKVLDNISSELTYHRLFVDLPGSMWPALMRLRLPAAIALEKPAEVEEVLRDWIPTGDAELETAVALLKLKKTGSDEEKAKAYKAAVQGNPANLPAAIAWLELGNKALETKDWPTAVRSFVSVQVFASSFRPLHPVALLGAVKACIGGEQQQQANAFAEELKNDFPRAPQTRALENLLKTDKPTK